MHFDLLRLFAPAPATNPSGTYLPYRDKYEAAVIEKSTVTDFIEKILKDLLEAEDILRKFDTEYHPEAMYASQMYEPTPEWNSRYRFNSGSYIDDMQDTCREQQMTVIVITHNLALTPMGDKVIRVKSGKIRSIEVNEHPKPIEEIEW